MRTRSASTMSILVHCYGDRCSYERRKKEYNEKKEN